MGTSNHNSVVAPSSAAITLLASGARTSGTDALATAVEGIGDLKEAQILLDVTAAGSAADDTLDVYVDTTLDGGTTWINVVHFTQVLGNGGAKKFGATLAPQSAVATAPVALTADAAAGAVRPGFLGNQLRARYTIVAGAGTHAFTFSVTAFAKG